jgi:hypothetical protein
MVTVLLSVLFLMPAAGFTRRAKRAKSKNSAAGGLNLTEARDSLPYNQIQ